MYGYVLLMRILSSRRRVEPGLLNPYTRCYTLTAHGHARIEATIVDQGGIWPAAAAAAAAQGVALPRAPFN
jgi:hypothetical protein